MDTPLSRFLEWYQQIPVLHQRKLALFILTTTGVSIDNDEQEKQGAESWESAVINRFSNEIIALDDRMSTAHIPPILKWEGVGVILSLRSQVDYLLSHDGFYYSTEGIAAEYSVLSNSFTSEKIKGFQQSQRVAAQEKKNEMLAQLEEIRNQWENFRNEFLEDEYIDEWCKSS